MKTYGIRTVEALIQKYVEYDGKILTVQDETSGCGVTICHGHGLKTTIITERYINGVSVREVQTYNEMPEKYRRLIMDYYYAIS